MCGLSFGVGPLNIFMACTAFHWGLSPNNNGVTEQGTCGDGKSAPWAGAGVQGPALSPHRSLEVNKSFSCLTPLTSPLSTESPGHHT